MGNAVHQAFHSVISDETAAALHSPTLQLQPFATSTLFRWRLDIPLRGRIDVGEMAWIRFTALHPYIFRELERYRRSNPRVIEIDRTTWQVMSCSWDGHLYAGRFSAAQRLLHHQRLPPPRLLRLRFLTETYFKSKGIEPFLTPEPRLVFGEGVLRRWEVYYPDCAAPEGFSQFLARHVRVLRCIGYKTSTVMVKEAVNQGFTGDVIYSVDYPQEATDWHLRCGQFLSLLAEYATYAGVGKKTTMGLGMVDRVRIVRLDETRPLNKRDGAKSGDEHSPYHPPPADVPAPSHSSL